MNEQLLLFDIVLNYKETNKVEIIKNNAPENPKAKITNDCNCPYPIPTVADIMKQIDSESYRIPKSRLISDIFACGAIALSNKFDLQNYDKREQEYLQIIKSYEPREQKLIAELFGKIGALLSSVVYDDGVFNDYLGELFMQCNQGNKNCGQFFTPYHLSKCIAKINITDECSKQGKIITINDPCCGSGGLILAGLDVLKNDYGFNYAHDCFVLCSDIDIRCVYMTYLQLSFAGVPAIITHQDTLRPLDDKYSTLYQVAFCLLSDKFLWNQNTYNKTLFDFNVFVCK